MDERKGGFPKCQTSCLTSVDLWDVQYIYGILCEHLSEWFLLSSRPPLNTYTSNLIKKSVVYVYVKYKFMYILNLCPSHTHTQGSELHWLACALYVACRTAVPTVDKGITEGNYVSLTRILRCSEQRYTLLKKNDYYEMDCYWILLNANLM